MFNFIMDQIMCMIIHVNDCISHSVITKQWQVNSNVAIADD